MSEGSFDSTEFNKVLNEYLKVSSRTVTEAINSKAYHVARKALWHTHKADRGQIEKELTDRPRYAEADSLAEAILIARYRNQGGWPGSGDDFERAVQKLINSRLRSVAFLKSGWIPAIRILGIFATDKGKAAPMDSAAKVYGTEKGSAYPAVEGVEPVASIVNRALAKGDEGGKALEKFGGKALDTAFYDDMQSMKQYLEDKLAKATADANSKL